MSRGLRLALALSMVTMFGLATASMAWGQTVACDDLREAGAPRAVLDSAGCPDDSKDPKPPPDPQPAPDPGPDPDPEPTPEPPPEPPPSGPAEPNPPEQPPTLFDPTPDPSPTRFDIGNVLGPPAPTIVQPLPTTAIGDVEDRATVNAQVSAVPPIAPAAASAPVDGGSAETMLAVLGVAATVAAAHRALQRGMRVVAGSGKAAA